jgi:hypothetical protein
VTRIRRRKMPVGLSPNGESTNRIQSGCNILRIPPPCQQLCGWQTLPTTAAYISLKPAANLGLPTVKPLRLE